MLSRLLSRKNRSSTGPLLFCKAVLFLIFLTPGFCEEPLCFSAPEVCCESCCESCCAYQPLVELKAGYFIFADSKARKVYKQGGFDVQISGSYPIWECLQLYGSVEYRISRGSSLNCGRTTLWETPVSLGLRPIINICECVQGYFTIGPRYFYVHQHNDSPYLSKNKCCNGIGGFVNGGFNFFVSPHILLDIFGEYSYERARIRTQSTNVYTKKVQVGGFTVGGGLGWTF